LGRFERERQSLCRSNALTSTPPASELPIRSPLLTTDVTQKEPAWFWRRTPRAARRDPVLLKQVVNDRLLVPVGPAGEEENDEGKRSRQRVHGASVPERPARVQDAPKSRTCAIGLGPSSGATSLLRLRRIRRLSRDRPRPSFRTGRPRRLVEHQGHRAAEDRPERPGAMHDGGTRGRRRVHAETVRVEPGTTPPTRHPIQGREG